jgi:hypothetical protein
MNTATMSAEAARCFRRACETDDPLDQTIFIGLRQAWLALALQVQHRRMEAPRLALPPVAADRGDDAGAGQRPRRTGAKRLKGRASSKSASRTRRRKLAA